MDMKKIKLPVTLILAATALMACGPSAPQLGKASIDEVIAAMTLEEKALLVVGTGMEGDTGQNTIVGATEDIVPGAAGTTHAIPRLGIPSIVLADGPAGLRIDPTREGDSATYYCTHFPIGTLLASTWDTELVESVGKAMGNEVLEYGADVLLAPALNIHRNPLNGRNFEYYSEDPVVSGKIAAAYVRGIQRNGVGTSVKHFAANNQETNRSANDAIITPRALREVYLRGFEIAVRESDPWTVMSSYNYLNGTFTSESHDLLTAVLRDDWGYRGMVMTDWFGGSDPVAQMQAGNDMLQPGRRVQREAIVSAVQDGTLPEAVLDRNVRRILELILKTPHFRGYRYSNHPDLAAHAAIARQSATEGMVLLKNEGSALPLGTDVKRVAVFGCTSYQFVAGGTGSGNVNRAYTVSLLDGLKDAGFEVDEDLKARYETYILHENNSYVSPYPPRYAAIFGKPLPAEMPLDPQVVAQQAQTSDVALLTIGRSSGEMFDRKVAGDFCLSKAESEAIQAVTRAFHRVGKKVVVVLNVGGVIETASWRDLPDAILLAWQAGQEGGNAVADVLSGRTSPSGKLTMTFPIRLEDHASTANFPIEQATDINVRDVKEKKYETRNVDYTLYEEGIYVGYRYFDSFRKTVSYPFGYGLSYTTFAYTNPTVKAEADALSVTVDVQNTGKVAGREVVQLYASAPHAAMSDKPEKELRAFAKTHELQPGESETISLTFPISDLASFDEAQSAWVVDAGTYNLLVGASSQDIRATLSVDVAAQSTPVSNALPLSMELQPIKR